MSNLMLVNLIFMFELSLNSKLLSIETHQTSSLLHAGENTVRTVISLKEPITKLNLVLEIENHSINVILYMLFHVWLPFYHNL